ncbi:MAG TPA: hypothetical protein VGN82_24355 [Bosea sp. (in: a-proteobacteria)]|jgi:hypothetical protein|uniref:hypothetical protein n=1 Tax=Bosea sp. (in: a-proteobacteria) TaxID=1871050 RepID=UPI002E0DA9E2|nr:hypothetical protein [Bosea sp. (in: a-proteobacteria)]
MTWDHERADQRHRHGVERNRSDAKASRREAAEELGVDWALLSALLGGLALAAFFNTFVG